MAREAVATGRPLGRAAWLAGERASSFAARRLAVAAPAPRHSPHSPSPAGARFDKNRDLAARATAGTKRVWRRQPAGSVAFVSSPSAGKTVVVSRAWTGGRVGR